MIQKPVVITIARQYGSGGKTIGEMLSEKLGIHFYNKELMKLASDESGINEALFVNADEKAAGSKFLGMFHKKYKGDLLSPDSDRFTSEGNLFEYQAKVIKALAEKESCVIVGRAADFVLKDYDNVLSVFIHAPFAFCMEQAALKVNLTGHELEKYIQKIDKDRADYYKYYTGREWTDARNYDLCLDSSKLGFERCVEEIISYMNVRFQ